MIVLGVALNVIPLLLAASLHGDPGRWQGPIWALHLVGIGFIGAGLAGRRRRRVEDARIDELVLERALERERAEVSPSPPDAR